MAPRDDTRGKETIDQLHRLLDEGRELTLDGMSERLDVSRRQVRRLLRQLRERGLTVTERWDEGQKKFALDPMSQSVDGAIDFQEQELFALTIASYAARSVLAPTPLQSGLNSAMEKLRSKIASVYTFDPDFQPRLWHFDAGSTSNIDPDIFETLVRAANRCETVEIDYFAASSRTRTTDWHVDPLLLGEQGGSWLLVARCRKTTQIRDFSLPGIREARPTGEYFRRPDDFDPASHFEDRFHALRGTGEHQVVLEVEADKAPYFRRKTYHPSQQLRNAEDGEHLIVEFTVSSLDDMAAFIRSWGPGVWVRKPERLADRIADEAQAVTDRYRGESSAGRN